MSAALEELQTRLSNPTAFLTRTDLRTLGLERRAVDALVRECRQRDGIIILPGYSRPMIRVATFHAVIADCTYNNTRVRPT